MLLETRGGHERRRKRYPAYKDSGVEWVGEVPEHWELKRLKYISTVNDDTLSETTDSDFKLLYVDIGSVDPVLGIKNKELMTFEIAPSRARRKVCHGDVILSTVRTYLRAISPINDPEPNMIVSTGFAVIRPKDGMESQFAAYTLRAPYFVDEVVANSVGVSYPAINANELITFNVALPSIPEQRAIAAFLDRETGCIDALIAKKERQIELLQEKRTALISHAVTKGLDPDAPMNDSGVEWLGAVPEHWIVAPLYARYRVQLGKMLDGKRITGAHLAPYLRNVNVQWGKVDVSDLPVMDFLPSERVRLSLQKGDLLVCEGGEVGRTAVWGGEIDGCYYQKAIHRLRPQNEIDYNQFFYYVMFMAAHMGVFVAGADISTIGHLTAEKLRKHRFVFPPKKEQHEIADYLDGATPKITGIVGAVSDSIAKLREYRTALISAAVTGKIDVRGEET